MELFIIGWLLVGIAFLIFDAIEIMQVGVDSWHEKIFNAHPIVYLGIRGYSIVLLWPAYAIMLILLMTSR